MALMITIQSAKALYIRQSYEPAGEIRDVVPMENGENDIHLNDNVKWI